MIKASYPVNLRQLGRVTRQLAHELRNPVAGIVVAAQVIQEQIGPDDPRAEAVELISSEAARLDQIIKNLESLAPERTARLLPSLVAEDVEVALRRVHELAERLHVRVARQFDPATPPALVDAELLQKALGNLLLNALEAMPAGGELDVWVCPAPQHGAVEIGVRDNGVGIQAYRLKEPLLLTRPGASGLALIVAKRLTESQRGQLLIESQPGRGSTARVFLQAAPRAAEDPPADPWRLTAPSTTPFPCKENP